MHTTSSLETRVCRPAVLSCTVGVRIVVTLRSSERLFFTAGRMQHPPPVARVFGTQNLTRRTSSDALTVAETATSTSSIYTQRTERTSGGTRVHTAVCIAGGIRRAEMFTSPC